MNWVVHSDNLAVAPSTLYAELAEPLRNQLLPSFCQVVEPVLVRRVRHETDGAANLEQG